MNNRKIFLILVLSLFLGACSSDRRVMLEPSLEQITVKSETFCLDFAWYNPFTYFCYEEKPQSLRLRAVMDNRKEEKHFYLDYYLDEYEKELPVGVSIRIGEAYYKLDRAAIDFVDSIKISSEVNESVLKEIEKAEVLGFSYSNRSNSANYEFKQTEKEELKSRVRYVLETIHKQKKMKVNLPEKQKKD